MFKTSAGRPTWAPSGHRVVVLPARVGYDKSPVHTIPQNPRAPSIPLLSAEWVGYHNTQPSRLPVAPGLVRRGGRPGIQQISIHPPPTEPYTQPRHDSHLRNSLCRSLLGLCFGSFLNVCLSRWPEGESIVHPRSHCRHSPRHALLVGKHPANKLASLHGRCRKCHA